MQVLFLAAACAAACPDSLPAHERQQGRPPLEVEVSHSREVLTGGRGEWTETAVRVTHREPGPRLIFLQGRHLHRFGTDDGDLTLGTQFPLAPRWTMHADAGFSVATVFLPEWNLGGLVTHALGGGWVGGYGARYLEYPGTPVIRQEGLVNYHTGPFVIGYTLTHTDVRNVASGFAHTGRAAMTYAGGSHVTAAATTGWWGDAVAPDDVRLFDLVSLGIGGTHWLDAHTGLAWGAAWHRQGEFFERSGLQLGVRQRF
jgi:YaiO family outer membrane protein